jgi:hypothetical protein
MILRDEYDLTKDDAAYLAVSLMISNLELSDNPAEI